MLSRYEAVIGLEVHAQLETLTKAFCACSTNFGDPPNSNTCPVCLGLPGALPVLNKKALQLALARVAGARTARFRSARASLARIIFIPDLPKGYQISMYELPLATDGLAGNRGRGRERSASASRACTWRTMRAKACTKDFRIPTAGATSISIAAACR